MPDRADLFPGTNRYRTYRGFAPLWIFKTHKSQADRVFQVAIMLYILTRMVL